MSSTRLERIWPGYGLTGKDLGRFLEEGYETIQKAWHQVYEAFPQQASVYEMYKSVVESSGVDRWAVNVRREAYEWSCSSDLEKREKGRYLLVHMCVGPIINGVDRALKQFSEINLNPDDLMQESLKLTLEKIDEKGIEFVTGRLFGARIGNRAYLIGERVATETTDIPISEKIPEDPLIDLDELVSAKLALSSLPARDRKVFELEVGLWGAPLSQREIGEQFNVSGARAGQLWRRTVDTLKDLNIPGKPE